jgi:hypothetical protein
MTPLRLVPRVLHLGNGPYLVVCAWYQTLDVAAMACWPDLLAENCRNAEGRKPPTEEWWGYLDLIPQPAFSQVN